MLWRTLTLWGMNKRRAELTPESVFRNSLRQCASEIGMLEDARLDAETLSATKTGDSIWGLIDRLRISATSARLVATTKALHHLLPHLVVPMDRQFTGAFFNWNNQAWQVKQEQSFKAAFLIFARIARSAKPAHADASRCPRGDRVGREPEGDVASPHEGSVVLGPVPDAIRCLVLRMHSRLHIEIMTRRRSRWSTCRPLLAHRAESAHQRPVSSPRSGRRRPR